jgi:hypothetical protein
MKFTERMMYARQVSSSAKSELGVRTGAYAGAIVSGESAVRKLISSMALSALHWRQRV